MNKGFGPTGMLPAGAVVAFHLNRVKPLNPHSPRKSLKNTSQKILPRGEARIPHLGHNGSIGRNLRPGQASLV